MRIARVVCCLLAVLATVATSRLHAEVTQPNGLVVPRNSMNGETQLFTLFSNRGETLHFTNDGYAQPSTFSPLCEFKATFLLKQTASNLGVAWYNVMESNPSPPTEVYTIFPANTPVGAVVTGDQIRGDEHYLGGDIGFVLLAVQRHYTESRYETICTGCNPQDHWVLSVIYPSTQIDNAFYVTFEDAPVGAEANGYVGNDGDYNDYVFLFEGLVCNGGGQPCDVPAQQGICAQGITQCVDDGIDCKQVVEPRTETCNGLDDDCNGAIDNGDLCTAGEVCVRGVCVAPCIEEFGCAGGYECQQATGACIETACKTVACDPGEVCREGDCVAACDGIVCPSGQECRAGRCADLCEGVTCNDDFVCDPSSGACVIGCACQGCGAGESCDEPTDLCIDTACVGIDCTEGTHCVAGSCVDDCDGAVCPTGQACMAGDCVDVVQGMPDGGIGTDDGGTNNGGDGGTNNGDGGNGGDGGDGGGDGTKSGCGCRTAGSDANDAGAAFAMLTLGLVVARRRARRAV